MVVTIEVGRDGVRTTGLSLAPSPGVQDTFG
jgi:hypothetical protein